MPRKPREVSFVSKADTKEMREYQRLASMYPPYSRREFVKVSRIFVKGRAAGIRVAEHRMLDRWLGGDWSDESRERLRPDAARLFAEEIELEYEARRMPKDVHDIMLDELAQLEADYDLFVDTRRLGEQEIRALSREKERGDSALDDMVNHNLQFAMSCVGKMMKSNRRAKVIGAKELIAVANVGLVLGARQYDPDSGRAFTTYAAYHINGQLYDYLNREDGNMGIRSATLYEQKQIITIRQLCESFKERYGREPRIREITSLTHISPDRVVARLATPTVRTQSIYAAGRSGKPGEDGDGEVFIPDITVTGDGVQEAMRGDLMDDAMATVLLGIAKLPPTQARIVRMMSGLEGEDGKPMTSRQIAKELGLSQGVVERETSAALVALRGRLVARDIDGDRIFADDEIGW